MEVSGEKKHMQGEPKGEMNEERESSENWARGVQGGEEVRGNV